MMKIISVLILLFLLSIVYAKAQPFKYVVDKPIEVDKYYDLDSAAVRELKKGDTVLLTGYLFPYWIVRIGNFNGYISNMSINETPNMKRYANHLDSIRFVHNDAKPDTVFPITEVYPEFINGPVAWRKYIAENLTIPKGLKSGETVKVWVKFVVEPDGSITHINVPDRPEDNYTKESIRLLKRSPKWKPGLRKGPSCTL